MISVNDLYIAKLWAFNLRRSRENDKNFIYAQNIIMWKLILQDYPCESCLKSGCGSTNADGDY